MASVLSLPRLVIAAPQGRSGKTTLSLGVCAALAGRGLDVQPFKKGPDYIDPSWLSEAAGRPCRSLDPFFTPGLQALRAALLCGACRGEGRGARRADLCLVEGNHGLYDSLEEDGSGSSAAVARVLQAPVILVVNAARMSRSAAAMVHGYQTFEPDTPIAAVILNNVAQGRHLAKLRDAIEGFCHIPVIGALPRDAALTIPDRHLGLVPRGEDVSLIPAIQACRQAAERFVDLEALLQIARSAPAWEMPTDAPGVSSQPHDPNLRPVIGVFRDQAFSFYYPENLEALEASGARLEFIDALHTPRLPSVDALYIGGGFPELFLEPLSQNLAFRQDVQQAVEAGLPVYAECGGLMYLSRRITYAGQQAEMAGVLPCDIEMTATPQGHGYVLAECTGENPFFPPGARLRGHEFHNSRLVGLPENWPVALRLERGAGIGGGRDGLVYRNVFASYFHLHTGGAPGWAQSLVDAARRYSS